MNYPATHSSSTQCSTLQLYRMMKKTCHCKESVETYKKNHTTDNSAITRTLTLSIMEDRIDEMHIALPFKNLCDLRKKVKQIVMFEICLG